jgi:hypothetical protein
MANLRLAVLARHGELRIRAQQSVTEDFAGPFATSQKETGQAQFSRSLA